MTKKSGFTMIELCVVLAILAVAASLAVPNLVARRADGEFRDALKQSISTMKSARMHAVRDNAHTVIIFDANENVFRAFVDNDRDHTYHPDTDRLIGVYDVPASVSISKSTFPKANQEAGRHYCSYNTHGLPVKAGRIELTGKTGRTGKVILAMSGRIRVE